MDILQREQLEELAQQQGRPCVSIYLPTHTKGVETLQDHILLKNLLKRAEAELERHGVRSTEARAMLEGAQALVENYDFWQHQSHALALFATQGFFRYYRVPMPLDELVVVTDRFHLKPLMKMLSGDGTYFVLALSGDEVRLLHCTRFGCRRVELPESVPRSFDEAHKYTDDEKQLQWHTRTAPHAGGMRAGMFYGNNAGSEDDKHRVLEYFQAIDKGLREVFREDKSPVVLAGVEYLHPIYRSAASNGNVLDEGIYGNPEGFSDGELHDRAWKVIEPHFHKQQQQAAEQFKTLAGVGRASHTIKEVVAAAHQGRIDTLFVATGLQHWGRFDPATFQSESHKEPQPGDEDLLDLAALQTMLKGGRVFAVDPTEIPNGALLAAVYRY